MTYAAYVVVVVQVYTINSVQQNMSSFSWILVDFPYWEQMAMKRKKLFLINMNQVCKIPKKKALGKTFNLKKLFI